MRYYKYLRLARQLSLVGPLPNKQHIVVCAAFSGKTLLGFRLNTESEHAEVRAMASCPGADRLVVYRFNRADASRADRTSCPCANCCPLILASNVRKVECRNRLGIAIVKTSDLEPYNEPRPPQEPLGS